MRLENGWLRSQEFQTVRFAFDFNMRRVASWFFLLCVCFILCQFSESEELDGYVEDFLGDSVDEQTPPAEGNLINHEEGMEGAEQRDLSHKRYKGAKIHKVVMTPVQPQYIQPIPLMVQRPLIVQELPTVTQRVETRRIITERSCPVGMILTGNQCVGREVMPPSLICPPSTRLMGGACVCETSPLVDCPPGFELHGGRCTSCEMIPAQFTCPNPAATLDATGMSCSMAIAQPPTCPPGFSMMGAQCIQRVPSVAECPPGYSWASAGQCIRTESFPAAVVCPDGATLHPDSQRCVVVKQEPPRCPHLFTFDLATQSCTRRVPEVPAPCPPGSTRAGAFCEEAVVSMAELSCPEGHFMDGSICVREIPVPPQCPPGYHQSPIDNSCVKPVKEIPICPEGTVRQSVGNSMACRSTMEHEIIQCCPPGFELEGNSCKRTEVLVAELSCENECYRVRSTKVAYACPDDAEFVDHPIAPKCVKRLMAPQCAEPVLPADCVPHNMRSLKGEESQDPACVPAEPVCTSGVQEEIMVAQAYCPEGGEPVEGRCVLREPIIPERICRIGALNPATGECVRETVVPIKSECPPGTIRQGMTCISYETHQPDFICPDNAVAGPDGRCLMSAPLIISPPRILKTPAIARCLSGQLAANNQCVEAHRTPMSVMCPDGSIDIPGQGCLITAELIVPPPVEKHVKASHVCPDGSRAMGRQCHSTETIQALSSCPMDSIPEGMGKCIRSSQPIFLPDRVVCEAAVPVCPPGTQPRGTTCMAVRETPALVTCPAGFVLEGRRCIRSQPVTPVCPLGTIQESEGCIRQTFAPALLRVVQGCVHDVTPTCSACPRAVASTCHHI